MRRILVVDDRADVRDLLEATLKRATTKSLPRKTAQRLLQWRKTKGRT